MGELSNVTFLFNAQAQYISRVTALEFLRLSHHCQNRIAFPVERLTNWLTKPAFKSSNMGDVSLCTLNCWPAPPSSILFVQQGTWSLMSQLFQKQTK